MISKDDLHRYKEELDTLLDDLLVNLPCEKEAFHSQKRRCQEASDQYATALLLYAEQVDTELAQAYYQESRNQGDAFKGFLAVLSGYQKRHEASGS